MEDYVVYHLTGKAQIDYSLATRTMAFDIRKLCWSREIFEAAGIDMNLMAKPGADRKCGRNHQSCGCTEDRAESGYKSHFCEP